MSKEKLISQIGMSLQQRVTEVANPLVVAKDGVEAAVEKSKSEAEAEWKKKMEYESKTVLKKRFRPQNFFKMTPFEFEDILKNCIILDKCKK